MASYEAQEDFPMQCSSLFLLVFLEHASELLFCILDLFQSLKTNDLILTKNVSNHTKVGC